MARLIGLLGNRHDLAARVLRHEAAVLAVHERGVGGFTHSLAGWGVGFHQGGEVLVRKRPIEPRQSLDVAELAADVRADSVIVQVRASQNGASRPENTQPFRYRQWLFAQTGSLAGYPAIRARAFEGLPQFLQAQVRGETDAELAFALVMSFLQDTGNIETDDPRLVGSALRSVLSLVDALAAEHGAARTEVNWLLSNGETMFALRRAAPMALREFAGRADMDALLGDDPVQARRIPELVGKAHFVLVASDFDETAREGSRPRLDADALVGWKHVPADHLVILRRGLSPSLEPL